MIESFGGGTAREYRREFCTLFDSNYLVKAVAMYRSLARHCPSFRLTAFCFDSEAERLLSALALPNLETVSLEELESFDRELLSVKHDRTPMEYCWTATPALPLFMFDRRPEIDEVTYIDADLMFFEDPEPLFEEMGDASVMITPHRYAREYEDSEPLSGTYNVSFLTFRRDEPGLECLQWWHDRCIEWCYFRYEDGKLGDQTYLNEWPERFQGIHVLQHKGGGLAPWNLTQYEIGETDRGLTVDGEPLVFYHYHRFSMSPKGRHQLAPAKYHLSRRNRRLIYAPYVIELAAAMEQIRSVEPRFRAGFSEPPSWRERLADLKTATSARALTGRVSLARRFARSG
jgi:hypothetical protein